MSLAWSLLRKFAVMVVFARSVKVAITRLEADMFQGTDPLGSEPPSVRIFHFVAFVGMLITYRDEKATDGIFNSLSGITGQNHRDVITSAVFIAHIHQSLAGRLQLILADLA